MARLIVSLTIPTAKTMHHFTTHTYGDRAERKKRTADEAFGGAIERASSQAEIFFNSKSSGPYAELSNFYGGVEACYMKDRFVDQKVKDLIDSFETLDKGTFITYLQQLQPDKKNWTQKQLDYWTRNGQPIRGILSKLVGNSVKPGSAASMKRLKVLKSMLGLQTIRINPPLSDTDKDDLMMACLRKKYAIPRYRQLLLSTGGATLHEKPMRGKGANDYWTFYRDKDGATYGGDHLGASLMALRTELMHSS